MDEVTSESSSTETIEIPLTFSPSCRARTLNKHNRHKEALALYDEILKNRTEQLGADHAKTLTTMHNKAYTLNKLGSHADALELYQDVLASREQVLGPLNPKTLNTMNSVAYTMQIEKCDPGELKEIIEELRERVEKQKNMME